MNELETDAAPGTARACAAEAEPGRWPPAAKTVRATGLGQQLLVELISKALLGVGKSALPPLSQRLRLSPNVLREVLGAMVAAGLAEAVWCGQSDIEVDYQLSASGRARAAEYLARCRYVGPAPVTLSDYRAGLERQASRRAQGQRVSAAALAAACGADTVSLAQRQLIGAALHSGRALLLHGPIGSGKSTLARTVARLLQGLIAVPHALLIDGKIIQFHDPLLHLAPGAGPVPARLHPERREEGRSGDPRWTVCQRPSVRVGAELSEDMLELRHDAEAGVYHAPPHFKANGGMFIIDELGSQRLPMRALLQRWLAPLEQGVDYLALPGGHKVAVPFDVSLVFATSIAHDVFQDQVFMRRIGFAVHVGPLAEAAYQRLFRHECVLVGLACDELVLEHLARLHRRSGRALLASYPRQLLGRVSDFASFGGAAPCLSAMALEQAWTSMFSDDAHDPAASAADAASDAARGASF